MLSDFGNGKTEAQRLFRSTSNVKKLSTIPESSCVWTNIEQPLKDTLQRAESETRPVQGVTHYGWMDVEPTRLQAYFTSWEDQQPQQDQQASSPKGITADQQIKKLSGTPENLRHHGGCRTQRLGSIPYCKDSELHDEDTQELFSLALLTTISFPISNRFCQPSVG